MLSFHPWTHMPLGLDLMCTSLSFILILSVMVKFLVALDEGCVNMVAMLGLS